MSVDTDTSGRYRIALLDELQDSVKLRFPILGDGDRLLLAAGIELTREFVDKLRARGISQVKIHKDDMGALRGGKRGPTAGPEKKVVKPSDAGKPFLENVVSHGEEGYSSVDVEQCHAAHSRQQDRVDELYSDWAEATTVDGDMLTPIAEESLQYLAADSDLFVHVGVGNSKGNFPSKNALQTAKLALAIGAKMGLDHRSLLALGVGCMAHDVGLLHIDRRAWASDGSLRPEFQLELTKHPAISFDMLRGRGQTVGLARLVAYQIHERCDGSGYPRGRLRSQLHPLALIGMVAAAYVDYISDKGPQRGLTPYRAVERILLETHQGRFDRESVRGLLNAVGLFPIGSWFQLADGRLARVMRAGTGTYSQPIVEAFHADDLDAPPEIINLAVANTPCIVRPIPRPAKMPERSVRAEQPVTAQEHVA